MKFQAGISKSQEPSDIWLLWKAFKDGQVEKFDFTETSEISDFHLRLFKSNSWSFLNFGQMRKVGLEKNPRFSNIHFFLVFLNAKYEKTNFKKYRRFSYGTFWAFPNAKYAFCMKKD